MVTSRSSQIQEDNDSDEDEMFGDDWVVIDNGTREKEKNNFTPAEIDESIKRETISMHSSKATCILVSPKNNGDNVSLTDFIIKKVIDKGSFGKVFLVEHNKTGKLYAMKRLNKDVILQKNQVENIKVEKEILF